jgi:hypothetical protein
MDMVLPPDFKDFLNILKGKHIQYFGCRSYHPLFLFGICDINVLGLLMKPKTRSIRINGGSEVFNDQFYMMFADALCVAEGFEFFKY